MFPLHIRFSQITCICMWGHFSVDEICYTKCFGEMQKVHHLSLHVKKQLSQLTAAEIARGWVGAVNLRRPWATLEHTGFMVQPALLAKRKSKTWTLLDVLTYRACILPRDSGNGKEQLCRPQGKLKAGLNKITHLPFVCFSTLLWKQRSACQPMRKSDRLHADHH